MMMTADHPEKQSDHKQPERPSPPAARLVDVRDLLGPNDVVAIKHGARRYLLRITKNNNLILTRDETARHEE